MAIIPATADSFATSFWCNPDFFKTGFELTAENALVYFCHHSNPLYDKSCINEKVKMQGLIESANLHFTGFEYFLFRKIQTDDNNDMFIICKQNRISPSQANPVAFYVITKPNNYVYKIPDLFTLLSSRLGRICENFNTIVDKLIYEKNNDQFVFNKKPNLTHQEEDDTPDLDLCLEALSERVRYLESTFNHQQ